MTGSGEVINNGDHVVNVEADIDSIDFFVSPQMALPNAGNDDVLIGPAFVENMDSFPP